MRPLIKKPSLDHHATTDQETIAGYEWFELPTNLKSQFLSKTVERLVDTWFVAYAESNLLLPVNHSAYRNQHSTETTLVHLYNDIMSTVNKGDVRALVLLDMLAAFDTIDHSIMLNVLQQRFDVRDAALNWSACYYADQIQIVVVGTDSSFISELRIGAPQGSVLGPRSFIAYAEDVTNVFEQHRVRHRLLADKMLGIKHSMPYNVCDVTAGLRACVTSVNNWCVSKHLQLNTKKTEVMWFGSATNLRKILSVDKDILVRSDIISLSPVVSDLGVFFDSNSTWSCILVE